jgi:hypothetical protein
LYRLLFHPHDPQSIINVSLGNVAVLTIHSRDNKIAEALSPSGGKSIAPTGGCGR